MWILFWKFAVSPFRFEVRVRTWCYIYIGVQTYFSETSDRQLTSTRYNNPLTEFTSKLYTAHSVHYLLLIQATKPTRCTECSVLGDPVIYICKEQVGASCWFGLVALIKIHIIDEYP